jgi:hypothetical protein
MEILTSLSCSTVKGTSRSSSRIDWTRPSHPSSIINSFSTSVGFLSGSRIGIISLIARRPFRALTSRRRANLALLSLQAWIPKAWRFFNCLFLARTWIQGGGKKLIYLFLAWSSFFFAFLNFSLFLVSFLSCILARSVLTEGDPPPLKTVHHETIFRLFSAKILACRLCLTIVKWAFWSCRLTDFITTLKTSCELSENFVRSRSPNSLTFVAVSYISIG